MVLSIRQNQSLILVGCIKQVVSCIKGTEVDVDCNDVDSGAAGGCEVDDRITYDDSVSLFN